MPDIIRWYSLHPYKGTIDLYGYKNNKILESTYQRIINDNHYPRLLYLNKGEINVNCTVVLDKDGTGIQTTKFRKVAGFGPFHTNERSIRRYEGPEGRISIYIDRIRRLRISNTWTNKKISFDITEAIEENNENEDEDNNKVIRWKWANKTSSDIPHYMRNSLDIFNTDLDWRDYPDDINREIEDAFQNNSKEIDIEIGMANTKIIFQDFDWELALQIRKIQNKNYSRVVKRFKINEEMEVDIENSDDVCCICVKNINLKGTENITFPCNHKMHKTCAFDMVSTSNGNNKCPLCRADFDPQVLKIIH